MDLSLKRIELIEWLARTNDESLIKKVDQIKKSTIKEIYEAKLRPMSSSEYQQILEKAEEDYYSGKVTSQEEFERESDRW